MKIYTIQYPISPETTTLTPTNSFDTIVLNMEVYVHVYVHRKSIIEGNIQEAHYLVLGECAKF